jgi:hypothetical protein
MVRRQLSKVEGGPQEDRTDYPSDAQEFSTTVRGGDIIVAFVSVTTCSYSRNNQLFRLMDYLTTFSLPKSCRSVP